MKHEGKTAQQVLDDYIAARRLAGTLSDAANYWRYHKGWYQIGIWNYRRKQVEEMTATLLARSSGSCADSTRPE
jgi:hypothetical protein